MALRRCSVSVKYVLFGLSVAQMSALGVLAGVGLVTLRIWLAGGVCHSRVRLEGKTVLITGANTGIGKETAVDLARRGARVIIACRDLSRANKAAADIRQRSGNGNVVVKPLDLASLQSVRQLAKDIQENEGRLDILINNAGIMMCPKWKTEDGFEMQFGVNHLGHFLLTNCLLDLLKKSAPSRIVNVSSLAHEKGQIHFDDINLDNDYDPLKSYRQSKLANVLFSRELAARLKDPMAGSSDHHLLCRGGEYRQRQRSLLQRLCPQRGCSAGQGRPGCPEAVGPQHFHSGALRESPSLLLRL
ncbi:retinol dehydrogenase 13 isoform X3 [Brienomyrus brachyistius]|uniref:retinol dehydrogenase 13 isoform X3 n=1 Tax=Brienomyrus brachyistius TaxID=42636 RepID=UPI0020B261AA|nr:retinol dehydrogenase 13 isoform X3 [Brienomyrus brachyistius]